MRLPNHQWLTAAEVVLSLIFVVCTAPQLNVLGHGRSSRRMRHDVMELQEGLFGAPVTIGTPHSRELYL